MHPEKFAAEVDPLNVDVNYTSHPAQRYYLFKFKKDVKQFGNDRLITRERTSITLKCRLFGELRQVKK